MTINIQSKGANKKVHFNYTMFLRTANCCAILKVTKYGGGTMWWALLLKGKIVGT